MKGRYDARRRRQNCAQSPKLILRPDVTIGELTADVPAWCILQDMFVVLSRATLLSAFGADGGLGDRSCRVTVD
jgi:hypothetical protein